MHKVAKAAAIAFAVFVLAAARLPEVRDGGQLGIKRTACNTTFNFLVG